ncbi:MAG: NADH-quinone oxidoreductase subunit B family protein [Leptospirillum sp.]|jgi:Ni,Fe-hydrogenase III small subunit|nr:hydrogenase [Nitrospiraceae bacterium]
MHHILLRTLKTGIVTEKTPELPEEMKEISRKLLERGIGRFGRSLFIRHLDAGSCNGCEVEIGMLGSPCFMLEHLGFKFVASPRHADLLLVTGPVSLHMRQALLDTYEAMPSPKLVVSVGGCADDGGIFRGSYAIAGGVSEVVPVDLHIPGCPPEPLDLIRGLMTAAGV